MKGEIRSSTLTLIGLQFGLHSCVKKERWPAEPNPDAHSAVPRRWRKSPQEMMVVKDLMMLRQATVQDKHGA